MTNTNYPDNITALYVRLSQEDALDGESNFIANQNLICQEVILFFNTASKKQRSVNPSWLQNSAVPGKCQGCRKARQSRFLDTYSTQCYLPKKVAAFPLGEGT